MTNITREVLEDAAREAGIITLLDPNGQLRNCTAKPPAKPIVLAAAEIGRAKR